MTNIGEESFYGCKELKFIAGSVINISVVAKQASPTSFVVNITSGDNISNSTFRGCTELTGISISNSVTSIDEGAFSDCSKLTYINISDSNDDYSSVDGILYNKNKTRIIHVPTAIQGTIIIPDNVTEIGNLFSGRTGLSNITIGNGVTTINERAFVGCTGLKSVKIGNSVTSIGDEAFRSLSRLTSIIIPDNIKHIGNYAFYDCSDLINLSFGKGVTNIGNYAFSNCHRLTSVTLPDSVIILGNFVFSNCVGLTSLSVGKNVTTFGKNAFYNCKELISVTIPNGVVCIGDSAFYDCKKLANITIPDSVTNIGSAAFNNTEWYINQPDGLVYAGKVAYNYKGTMPSNTTIVLKEGTLGIADSVFLNCSSLTSVKVSKGLTSIGNHAFYCCTRLTNISFDGTIAQWQLITKGKDWKYEVSKECTVVCTDGTIPIAKAG